MLGLIGISEPGARTDTSNQPRALFENALRESS
jgi:hypothetical protein